MDSIDIDEEIDDFKYYVDYKGLKIFFQNVDLPDDFMIDVEKNTNIPNSIHV